MPLSGLMVATCALPTDGSVGGYEVGMCFDGYSHEYWPICVRISSQHHRFYKLFSRIFVCYLCNGIITIAAINLHLL